MDRHSLKKQIQNARPSLKVVSPLAHWVMCVYAGFNIALGVSFLLAIDQSRITASLIIVNDLLTYKFWGIIFILVGLLKFYAITQNNWNLARKSLLVGVSIKAAWLIALIIRAITSPGTWLVTIMWIALALVQIGTYIYFMPPAMSNKTKEEQGDGGTNK